MKDQEHMRGMRKSTIVPNMLVEVEIIFSEVSQKAFLNNSLTSLLSNYERSIMLSVDII